MTETEKNKRLMLLIMNLVSVCDTESVELLGELEEIRLAQEAVLEMNRLKRCVVLFVKQLIRNFFNRRKTTESLAPATIHTL
jgi:hypothetical protein